MPMLYKATLDLHNLTWWIILLSGLWAAFRAWRGTLAGAAWARHERLAGLVFSSALATQLLIGLAIYFQSPVVHGLLAGGAAGDERWKAVFFGAIHPTAMIVAVVLGQAGYSISKRMADDRGKFRVAAFCFAGALAIVLLAVPWPFLSYGRSLLP
jgi:hypothetical protein